MIAPQRREGRKALELAGEVAQDVNDLSHRLIGACLEVHRHLGPGLLESAYEACLCAELTSLHIPFVRQQPLPLVYKGMRLDAGYQLDVVVGGSIIVELKSVEKLLPVHEAQLIAYSKLTALPLGLLINFNVPLLRNGIVRRANTINPTSRPLRLGGDAPISGDVRV